MSIGSPRVAFYGDDVTGSTDAMESFAASGLDTLLFLDLPSADECRKAAESHDIIGLAGTSRAKDPAWMKRELPAVFSRLRDTGAPVMFYKVCSTFDSSPAIGSIGCAIEVGRTPGMATPLIVGAPALGRYTAFGTLFAKAGDTVFRIDRHPTMSRHPVTPMREADLRLHLKEQTDLSCGLFDLAQQAGSEAEKRLQEAFFEDDIMLIDVMDAASQRFVGRQLWSVATSRDESLFCVGSSGLGAALVAHWQEAGDAKIAARHWERAAVDTIAVVSGSCSPATQGQIDWAERNGFDTVTADPILLVSEGDRGPEFHRVRDLALHSLENGRSPIIHTARGPDDPAITRLNTKIRESGWEPSAALSALGRSLGLMLRDLAETAGLARVAVAGGDTSGEVAAALGLRGLTMKAAISPGAPLCHGFAVVGEPPTIEIALKGGQMGAADYFGAVRAGGLLE